jgi:uncharacterized membrane protein
MERVYLFLHLLGVLLLFGSLGALTFHVMNGGDRATNPSRKLIMMTHGISLVIILIAGVGLLHRGFGTFADGWVHAKLGIWLVLGASPAIIYRVPKAAKMLWFVLPLLGGFAFYFARFKLG